MCENKQKGMNLLIEDLYFILSILFIKSVISLKCKNQTIKKHC